MAKLSNRRREALESINAVPEGILRGIGAFAAFIFDNTHLCYLADAEGLARQKLCKIDKIGESTFIRITAKGRSILAEACSKPERETVCCYIGVKPTFRCPGCPHDAITQDKHHG